MRARRAIVVGGGIAGTATAIGLRRVGVEVTVYEAYADPAGEVGSFVSLAANGLRGLRTLGCLDDVRAAGFAVPDQRMWSGSGRLLGAMPRGRLAGDDMIGVTLMRRRLVEVLRAHAVRAGVRIATGHRLIGVVREPGRVVAEFEDGTTDEAELLVGADGLWSTTRALLDPAGPSPVYAGAYSVSGIAEGVDVGPAGTFNMTFGRGGAFIDIASPDGTTWWSAQPAAPRPPRTSGVGDDEWVDRLVGVYAHESRALAVLGASTRVHGATRLHTLAGVGVRHEGRIVLVGDAAHPVGAGQGASMAIEDAVVLARTLAEAGAVEEAFVAFDRERGARVGRMLKTARAGREAKLAGPIRRRVDDLVMPIVFRHVYARATAWLYTHDLGALPAPAEGSRPTP